MWLVEYFDGFECADALAIFDDEEKAKRLAALWPGRRLPDSEYRIGFAEVRELALNDTSAWAEPLERLDNGERLYGIDMEDAEEFVLDPVWTEHGETSDLLNCGYVARVYAKSLEEALAKVCGWRA